MLCENNQEKIYVYDHEAGELDEELTCAFYHLVVREVLVIYEHSPLQYSVPIDKQCPVKGS